MKCPTCEEGILTKIIFKSSKRQAFLCEVCGKVWYDDEGVHASTGSTIQSLTEDGDMEYTFMDVGEKDEESKSVMYSKFK